MITGSKSVITTVQINMTSSSSSRSSLLPPYIPDTRVIVQGTALDRVAVIQTGLATNRRDTFPAFLRFYMVSFLASLSGT